MTVPLKAGCALTILPAHFGSSRSAKLAVLRRRFDQRRRDRGRRRRLRAQRRGEGSRGERRGALEKIASREWNLRHYFLQLEVIARRGCLQTSWSSLAASQVQTCRD